MASMAPWRSYRADSISGTTRVVIRRAEKSERNECSSLYKQESRTEIHFREKPCRQIDGRLRS